MSETQFQPPMSHARLVRNSLFNVAGQGLPLLAAIVAFPWLIHGLGADRFGVLALAWVLVGYAGLFDFGLGRALTQLVAQRLGSGHANDVPALAWTALAVMSAAGVAVAAILMVASTWLVTRGLRIPADLQAESLEAVLILSISIPFVTCSAGLRGLLEAKQQFGPVNVIRGSLGILTFLGPVAVLFASNHLGAIMWVLVTIRIAAWAASLMLCVNSFPELRSGLTFRRNAIPVLIATGGWITVSNVVSPVITYLDRFLIGALVSTVAVAYYVTPYEVITKVVIFPLAFATALFPEFAVKAASDARQATILYVSSLKYVFVLLFPIVLVAVAFTPEALALWLGSDFSKNSSTVLRVLAAGVLLNGLAQVPFALTQAAGRADWTAKLHLAELIVYVPVLYAAIAAYGIVGAATAWSARVAIDLLALAGMARSLLSPHPLHTRSVWLWAGVTGVALAGAWLVQGLAAKALFLGAVLTAFALVSWRVWLSAEEKTGLMTWFARSPESQDRSGH